MIVSKTNAEILSSNKKEVKENKNTEKKDRK